MKILFSLMLFVTEIAALLSVAAGNNSSLTGPVSLVQKYRPPQQTSVQNVANALMTKNSKSESNGAYNAVKKIMQDMINWGQLKDIPSLKSASADDLMKYMAWEFKHIPLLHNGPLFSNEDSYGDDTDFSTCAAVGYIQNVCQRFLLGAETFFNFNRESDQMERYQGYPPYKTACKPTLREANDRMIYLASNWLKTHAGNFLYGKMTYVVNPIYQDKFAVAPCDNAACLGGGIGLGTLDDFWHLIQPFLTYTAQGTDLSYAFHRWYGNYKVTPTPWGAYPYFEIEMAANMWLPEALLYSIVVFDGLWGTDFGTYVENWMRDNKRPLIWSNGDDSGMLIDPSVNWVSSMQGGFITQSMIDSWASQWRNHGLKFSQLYDSSPNAIRFQFPGYFTTRQACQWHEDNGYNVMGMNFQGDCVAWEWESNANYMWERLNDGTCAKSSRGTHSSESSCLDAANRESWYCQHNPSVDWGAGSYATFCVQDSQAGGSSYKTLESCEAVC